MCVCACVRVCVRVCMRACLEELNKMVVRVPNAVSCYDWGNKLKHHNISQFIYFLPEESISITKILDYYCFFTKD